MSVTAKISDHHSVECCLSLRPPLRLTKRVSYRSFKSVDLAAFEKDVEDLSLLVDQAVTLDVLVVAQYNEGMAALVDKNAPVKSKTIVLREPVPWMNCEL